MEQQECGLNGSQEAAVTVRDWGGGGGGGGGGGRKVQENAETGKEMTLFLLSSSQQGLLCP